MNVIHLLDERWDSGLSSYALVLAEGQRRDGRRVAVWAPKAAPAFAEARRRGLEVFPLDRPWLRLPSLRAELKRFQAGVLNAHTGRTHTLAVLLSRGTAACVVRTRADARPSRARPGASWLLSRTGGFIAANRGILAEAEAAGGLPAASAVVRQGFDPDGPFRSAPVPPGAPVGILARLDPVKGHEDFLQAAALARKSCPELEFVVAGADANLKSSELRALGVELGLAEALRLAGRVDDVPSFMRSCRFGVIASKGSEAVSRAALEWMACGRAVVATSVGGLPELVENGKTGLVVPPHDPAALAAAMVRLAKDAELCSILGRRGRDRIAGELSLRNFVESTDRVYREALAPAGAPL